MTAAQYFVSQHCAADTIFSGITSVGAPVPHPACLVGPNEQKILMPQPTGTRYGRP